MTVGGYRLWPLLKSTGQEIAEDNLTGLASQLAYSFFFALFPILLVVMPLVGLIGNQQQLFEWAMSHLAQALPPAALDLVRGVVSDTVFAPSAPGLISVGAVLALWSGSNLFSTLMDALNRAYDVTETRPFWKRRLICLAAVLATSLLVLIASAAVLAGPQIAGWISNHTALGRPVAVVWSIVQWPLAFTVLVLAHFLVFYLLPCLRQRVRTVLVGSVVGAALWVIVTLLFRVYVQSYASYNKTYGTIGGVIVLLTWMYLTMLATLSAGELNSQLQLGVGSVKARSTVTYAGRIVTAQEPSPPSTDRFSEAQGGSAPDGTEQHRRSAAGGEVARGAPIPRRDLHQP
ncbi:MAG TPA: YihY/virulence factor BrkB family protein [Gemmatimonadaceae bacterium]|nr:YihY/virulence factor BrkB family protein [Gemmatimonadaceae bacterium]